MGGSQEVEETITGCISHNKNIIILCHLCKGWTSY